jgi:glyoxylase-like metal-dependent hydrolase (beta-lactamase superfamily II)
VIVERIVADALSENCYVLAGSGTSVVIDPGGGTAGPVREVHERHGLSLGCVLLTHAHPDHVWDVAEVAGDAPVHVPSPDRYRLEDPLGGTPPDLLAALGLEGWRRPTNIQELDGAFFEGGGAELVPGVVLRAVPAPGHTEGSSVYLLSGMWPPHVAAWVGAPSSEEPRPLALTGDVVFRGSVGRTDLPGGDANVMAWTLRTLRQVIDPRTWLLPGHGPGTTWHHELTTNPFLVSRR